MVGSHPPRPLAWPRPAPCRPPTDDTDASAPGDGYADWEDGPCGVMTLTRGAPTPTNNDPTVQPALTAPGSRRLSRLPTAPYLSLSDKAPASGPVPSPLLLTPSSTTARSPLWASPPPSVFLTDAASPSPSSSSVQHQPVSLCTEPAAPQRRPPGSRLPPSTTSTPGRPSLRQLPRGHASSFRPSCPPLHLRMWSELPRSRARCLLCVLPSKCVHPPHVPIFLSGSFVRVSHYPC